MTALLEVRELSVDYPGPPRVHALNRLSLELPRGGSLAIVGESGSGKSTLAMTLLGLLRDTAIQGEVRLGGEPLPIGDEAAMRPVRWRRLALAFQSAATGFDPVQRVRDQIAEPLRVHLGLPADEAERRVRALWDEVGLPAARLGAHPHQLSGGQLRRAMLAMALACDPEVLIADEPTAGLDAALREELLALLDRRRRSGLALLLVTHDLSDARSAADELLVLYAGAAVERGPASEVADDPRHPYSWALLQAHVRMDRAQDLVAIRGTPPDPTALPAGCTFHPRCTQVVDRCRTEVPPLQAQDGRRVACHLGGLTVVLRAREISHRFDGLMALQAVSLAVRHGEVLAVVGPSGSGKTTLARALAGVLRPERGSVEVAGVVRTGEPDPRAVQLIFQDPADALSPRLDVRHLIREPLDLARRPADREARDRRVREVLAQTGLPATEDFWRRYPHQLSGGQLQRVALARALVLEPRVLVADEPASQLDASEQARLLLLLRRLQHDRGLALILVAHDLALVRKVSDRVLVLVGGQAVETGPTSQIVEHPSHPATRALVAAARRADQRPREEDLHADDTSG